MREEYHFSMAQKNPYGLKKRYLIEIQYVSGKKETLFASDLETAKATGEEASHGAEVVKVRLLAMYTRKKSMIYMDQDNYSVVLQEWN